MQQARNMHERGAVAAAQRKFNCIPPDVSVAVNKFQTYEYAGRGRAEAQAWRAACSVEAGDGIQHSPSSALSAAVVEAITRRWWKC